MQTSSRLLADRLEHAVAVGADDDLQQRRVEVHAVAPDQGEDVVADAGHGGLVGALDVEAQQRLGVGRADVEPPVVGGDGEPVEVVERRRRRVAAYAASTARRAPAAWSATSELISPLSDVALVVGEQLGERPVGLGEGGERVQRGEHPGVGPPEVAEVEVPAVLAAEDRVGLGHRRLDEGVADPGAHRACRRAR